MSEVLPGGRPAVVFEDSETPHREGGAPTGRGNLLDLDNQVRIETAMSIIVRAAIRILDERKQGAREEAA